MSTERERPDGVEVVRVEASTAGLLDQVAEDVLDGRPTSEGLTALLADDDRVLVVAVADGVVVGQCAAQVQRHVDRPPELYVENLGTAPTHRRRGIARDLVADVLVWGRERGCGAAWLATEPDNDAALALYTALGGEVEPAVVVSLPIA